MRLYDSEPRSRIFVLDIVLWRATCVDREFNCEPVDIDWEKTEKGNYAARVQVPGDDIWEPEINTGSGMMVFVAKPPRKDWTHLVLSGASHKVKEGGPGGALFAVVPDANSSLEMDDYLSWRSDYARAVRENQEASIEEKVEIATRLSIISNRRLVIARVDEADDPSARYDYEFVQDGEACDEYWESLEDDEEE